MRAVCLNLALSSPCILGEQTGVKVSCIKCLSVVQVCLSRSGGTAFGGDQLMRDRPTSIA